MYKNNNVTYYIMVKIAIYSCNFGDYRNEFSRYYNCFFDEKIDYFLFTEKICDENELLKLQKWNVCNMNILESDEIMDGFRWTSKFVKFILPEKLKEYNIIVWIDNKKVKELHKLTYENILNITNKYPLCDVFNLKHFRRNTIQEELIETIKIGVENKQYGEDFLIYIGDFNSKFSLPDTCIIIRKNTEIVNDTFQYCFNLMKEYKLKRDQNIYNFAFDKKNITPCLLDYYTLDFLHEKMEENIEGKMEENTGNK